MLAFVVGLLAVGVPLVAPRLGEAVGAAPQTVVAHQRVQLEARAPTGAAPRARTDGRTYSRARRLPIRANLVGASWRGQADSVEVRARSLDGRWSRWVPLVAEPDEGPDAHSREARESRGWRVVANPLWVGDAADVQVRVPKGEGVRELDLVSINSTGTASRQDRATTQLRKGTARVLGTEPEARASTNQPRIITRGEWGADESIRRNDPSYADRLLGTVVHHTVSSNTYARGDAPAMVRGIYAYHVRSNGWSDVGYNFIVDKYGQVFEGRYGGTTSPVIGAHTMGFNTSTAGIALLGTHGNNTPTAAAQQALTDLVSWRLDQAHVNPAGTATLRSAGNDGFPAGTTVTKRAVGGHRDLFSTECPGSLAYNLIDGIRTRAWTQYGPKFANLSARVQVDPATGSVRSAAFTAVGNQPLEWALRVRRRADSAVVFESRQTGSSLNVAWDGASGIGAVRADDLDWTIDAQAAGVAATPSHRSLTQASPPPSPVLTRRSGAVTSPNGDGLDDQLVAPLRLLGSADVRAEIVNATDASTVHRTLTAARLGAGLHTLRWDGARADGTVVDGAYRLRVVVDDPVAGRADSELLQAVRVDRALALRSMAAVFSPNADRVADVLAAPLVLGEALKLNVVVRRGGSTRRVLHDGPLAAEATTISYDGRDGTGAYLADGSYYLRASAARPWGTLEVQRSFRVDRTPPRVKALARRGFLRLYLSERAKVTATVANRRKSAWVRPGWSNNRSFAGARALVVRDAVGNVRAVRVR